MKYLIIGNISAGKTSLAKALMHQKGIENYFSIDDFRKKYSDGSYAGEFMAWSYMLRMLDYDDVPAVYEFSGTGKNKWFVREIIRKEVQSGKPWRVVFCSCNKEELIKRATGRTYDIPIPYVFGNPIESINYMGKELGAVHGSGYFGCPEITVRTDQNTPQQAAEIIVQHSK